MLRNTLSPPSKFGVSKIRVLFVDMDEFLNRRSGRQITPVEEGASNFMG